MYPVFTAPLRTLLRPDYRTYDDHSDVRVPAATELLEQLEGRWEGVDNLPSQRQRALQHLVMRIRRLRVHEGPWAFLTYGPDLEDDAVDDKGRIKPSKSLATVPARTLFDDDSRTLIDSIASKHAYVATVTIALIAAAKETSGVLPSTDFLWSRSKDRHFWKLINGYGRPRQLADVAGAFAHYTFEKKVGQASLETHFEKCRVQT